REKLPEASDRGGDHRGAQVAGEPQRPAVGDVPVVEDRDVGGGEVGGDLLARYVAGPEDHRVVRLRAPDRVSILLLAPDQERPRDPHARVAAPAAQLGDGGDRAVKPLVGADRAEGEHDLPGAGQVEPPARAGTIGPDLGPEEASASEMNELDPRAGAEPPPCRLLGPPRVDDDRVGGGEAAPERPVVPADALVRADVV